MKTKQLYQLLSDTYTNENLTRISQNVLRLYKEKQYNKLRLIFEMISDFSVKKSLNNKQLFSLMISLYHPDKLEFYLNELANYQKTENEEILSRLKHILLILNIEELSADIENYEDIDYIQEFELDLDYEGLNFFTDSDKKQRKTKKTKKKLPKLNFYDAIKIRMYGNTEIEFPPYYLEDLAEIELSGSKITDLEGVQFCKQTEILDLSNNRITDLSLLSELHDLGVLNLANNKINDIDVLGNLKKIRSIDLSFNKIDDISVLFELPTLEFVNLTGNKIKPSDILELQKNGIETEV